MVLAPEVAQPLEHLDRIPLVELSSRIEWLKLWENYARVRRVTLATVRVHRLLGSCQPAETVLAEGAVTASMIAISPPVSITRSRANPARSSSDAYSCLVRCLPPGRASIATSNTLE